MKKNVFVSALALLLAAACLLSSCAKTAPKYFTMTAAKDAYAPGEEIEVNVTLNNVENVALFDLKISFDADVLTLTDAVQGSVSDFILMTNPKENYVLINGFCATTCDFTSETVATLYFTVNEGASGKIKLLSTATSFQIGTDDRGDETQELTDKKNITSSLTLNVAG